MSMVNAVNVQHVCILILHLSVGLSFLSLSQPLLPIPKLDDSSSPDLCALSVAWLLTGCYCQLLSILKSTLQHGFCVPYFSHALQLCGAHVSSLKFQSLKSLSQLPCWRPGKQNKTIQSMTFVAIRQPLSWHANSTGKHLLHHRVDHILSGVVFLKCLYFGWVRTNKVIYSLILLLSLLHFYNLAWLDKEMINWSISCQNLAKLKK